MKHIEHTKTHPLYVQVLQNFKLFDQKKCQFLHVNLLDICMYFGTYQKQDNLTEKLLLSKFSIKERNDA